MVRYSTIAFFINNLTCCQHYNHIHCNPQHIFFINTIYMFRPYTLITVIMSQILLPVGVKINFIIIITSPLILPIILFSLYIITVLIIVRIIIKSIGIVASFPYLYYYRQWCIPWHPFYFHPWYIITIISIIIMIIIKIYIFMYP